MTISALGRVPADHVAVVERIGRVERVVPAGERVRRLPVLERVSRLLSMRTHRLVLRDQAVVVADQVAMLGETEVDYRIVDAMATATSVNDYQDAVRELAVLTLRQMAGRRDSEAMLVSSGAIGASLQKTLTDRITGWGLGVTRTDVSITRHRSDSSPTSSTEVLGY